MSLTFKNLQDKVLGWLDETDDSTVVLANVKEAIAAANAERAGDREWKFMLDSDTIAVVVGTTDYSLPSDFNTMESLYSVNQERTLTQVPHRHWYPGYTRELSYIITGTTLKLLYTPTATDTLNLRYFRQPQELSADADIPDIPYPYSRILIYDALLDLGLYSEDISSPKVQRWMQKQQQLELALLTQQLDSNSLNAASDWPMEPRGEDDL